MRDELTAFDALGSAELAPMYLEEGVYLSKFVKKLRSSDCNALLAEVPVRYLSTSLEADVLGLSRWLDEPAKSAS